MTVVGDPVSYNGNLLRELNLNVFHEKSKQSQEKVIFNISYLLPTNHSFRHPGPNHESK